MPTVAKVLLSLIVFSSSLVQAETHRDDYLNDPQANTISIGSKFNRVTTNSDVEPQEDKIFVDGLGREVILRGWNVSGSVKLKEKGFKPFFNVEDAQRSFDMMSKQVGSNFVRFTIGWEGIHPAVDEIDYEYLDAIIAQMRVAISNGIYLFLDYHMDLYSRHLFHAESQYTGNGAPAWITPPDEYPKEFCYPFCFAWSQNLVTNEAIQTAYRRFWSNSEVNTEKGVRRVQDEFLWQLQQMASYIKSQLTPEEFRFVLGIQPLNEPAHGHGFFDGYLKKAAAFDNEKLWPFNHRVRAAMDAAGWNDQWVFVEPLVFWHTNAGIFSPPTGGQHLKELPGEGFVFAPHFYDAARHAVTNFNKVFNAEYFYEYDVIREEARFLKLPVVMGEYGMWLNDRGGRDAIRMLQAMYQGMEVSDHDQPEKNRQLDLYTLSLGGTQWHWDIYRNQHNEIMNGNPNKVMTAGDGWNEEDFSVVEGDQYTLDAKLIERSYPRRIQGRLLHFYNHSLPTDSEGGPVAWADIRLNTEQTYLDQQNFSWTLWQGRHSEAPTEIYVPRYYNVGDLVVITDQGVRLPSANLTQPLTQDANEIALRQDNKHSAAEGYRVLVWDDDEPQESEDTLHFALVTELQSLDLNQEELLQFQRALTQKVIAEKENPLYLVGKMVGAQYPQAAGEENWVDIDATTYDFWIVKMVKLYWSAGTEFVDVFRNGRKIATEAAVDKSFYFSLTGSSDQFKVCEQGEPTHCSEIYVLE